MRVVVLGVGNILMTDEGVGVHAVTRLEEIYEFPESVELIDAGTSGMDCLDRIAHADLLLIADCMRSRQAPGTISRLADDQIKAWFKTKISPHQVGLSDVLAACAFHDMSPKRVVLWGVEPESFDVCLELTPTVSAVLPDLCDKLLMELAEFGIHPVKKAA